MKVNIVAHCECFNKLRITRTAVARRPSRNVDQELEITVKPCRFCSKAKTDDELDRQIERGPRPSKRKRTN